MNRRLLERVQLTIHDKQKTVPLGSTLYVVSAVYTLEVSDCVVQEVQYTA